MNFHCLLIVREKDITWETNTNMNLGVEFELLKGKLNGGVELFYRKTTDMLNWFNVPLSLGYPGYYDNIGDMANKGVELELNYIPVNKKEFYMENKSESDTL